MPECGRGRHRRLSRTMFHFERFEILKWAGIVLVVVALFTGTHALLSDDSSPLRRYHARYVAHLERNLRLMFNFTSGARIALGQMVALPVFLLVAGFGGLDLWLLVMGLAVIAFGPSVYIDRLRRQRVEKIEKQLDAFLLAMSNALKSTPSIGDAFASVQRLLPAPIGQEIELAVKEMRVGSTLDQAVLLMASRIGSRQVDSALSALLIGRQIGGNMPKILDTTAATLREMSRLEAVVRTKTAEGKSQLWVLALFPALLIVGLSAINPGYLDPLTETATGMVLVVVGISFWVAAIVLARRILNVDI